MTSISRKWIRMMKIVFVFLFDAHIKRDYFHNSSSHNDCFEWDGCRNDFGLKIVIWSNGKICDDLERMRRIFAY